MASPLAGSTMGDADPNKVVGTDLPAADEAVPSVHGSLERNTSATTTHTTSAVRPGVGRIKPKLHTSEAKVLTAGTSNMPTTRDAKGSQAGEARVSSTAGERKTSRASEPKQSTATKAQSTARDKEGLNQAQTAHSREENVSSQLAPTSSNSRKEKVLVPSTPTEGAPTPRGSGRPKPIFKGTGDASSSSASSQTVPWERVKEKEVSSPKTDYSDRRQKVTNGSIYHHDDPIHFHARLPLHS